MASALDWAHRHKKLISLILVGIAASLHAADHAQLGDGVLAFGTLTGFGWLPNGPNPLVAKETL